MEALRIEVSSMYRVCHFGRSSSGGIILITDILYLTIERFLKYMPILVITIIIAQFIRLYIREDTIGILFKRKARRNILVGSLLGLVTPGPLSAFLPLLRVLKRWWLAAYGNSGLHHKSNFGRSTPRLFGDRSIWGRIL